MEFGCYCKTAKPFILHEAGGILFLQKNWSYLFFTYLLILLSERSFMKDIKYLQRYDNFRKSFLFLSDALTIENPSLIEKAGIIQFFEISFVLSWKLMKDYIEDLGYDIMSPRDSIKTGFQAGIINNVDLWLDTLVDRNLTVQTYDEEIAKEIYCKIKSIYASLIDTLYKKFKDEICYINQEI